MGGSQNDEENLPPLVAPAERPWFRCCWAREILRRIRVQLTYRRWFVRYRILPVLPKYARSRHVLQKDANIEEATPILRSKFSTGITEVF